MWALLHSGYTVTRKSGGPGEPLLDLLANALSLFTLEAGPALYFWPAEYVFLTWVGAVGVGWVVRALFGVLGRNASAMTVLCLWIYPWLSVGVCFTIAHAALGIPRDALALALIPTMLVQSVVGGEAMSVAGMRAGVAMNAVALLEMVVATQSSSNGVVVMPFWGVVLGARYLACAPSWPCFFIRALLLGWRSFTGIGILAVAEFFASSCRNAYAVDPKNAASRSPLMGARSLPERVMFLVGAWIAVLLLGEWTPVVMAFVAILEVPMLFFW